MGDLNLTVREIHRLEDALPKISKALRIALPYAAPDLKERIQGVLDLAARHPGSLPLAFTLVYGNGVEVDLSLKSAPTVAVSLAFLSELAKIVPQSETYYDPSGEMRLTPPEPRPWER